jgi:hypothetical protein
MALDRLALLILIALAACHSEDRQHARASQAGSLQGADPANDPMRQPCDSPYPCKDWLIPTPGFLHGSESVRFGASFRTVRDTLVIVWLDSAIGHNADGPIWVAIDTLGIKLEQDELLAHTCGLTGKELDNQTVAVVRDTVASTYSVPRLAWRFDLHSSRIRPVSPDSVHCVREFIGE